MYILNIKFFLFRLAFGCAQHPKTGRNTQHFVYFVIEISTNAIVNKSSCIESKRMRLYFMPLSSLPTDTLCSPLSL